MEDRNKQSAEKKTTYVSIATQKGGAGKSSFTILAASILHYTFGKNVAVIDCDSTQGTIFAMRNRDIKALEENPKFGELFAKQYSRSQKTPYPVMSVDELKKKNKHGQFDYLALDLAEKLSKKHDLDYVFFDIPGSVKVDGVLTTLSMMDYVFCPFSPVISDVESSASFCGLLIAGFIEKGAGNLKAVYGFWNEVDGRVKTSVFNTYSPALEYMGIKLLNTRVPQLVRFGRELSDNQTEIFKSTLLAPRPNVLYGSKVNNLIDEMVSVMNAN